MTSRGRWISWLSDGRSTAPHLRNLSGAISRQLMFGGLTPAEAEIAGLMLKGVALRDIARLRQTSETTIRQQAHGVYRKSGLSGRAELAAISSSRSSRIAWPRRPGSTRQLGNRAAAHGLPGTIDSSTEVAAAAESSRGRRQLAEAEGVLRCGRLAGGPGPPARCGASFRSSGTRRRELLPALMTARPRKVTSRFSIEALRAKDPISAQRTRRRHSAPCL